MDQLNQMNLIRKRSLDNSLAQIQNGLHSIIHNQQLTWEDKIALIQRIQKLWPDILRLMIYFNNIK